MQKLGESYSTGKDGEKDTWVYLKKYRFVRPSKEQRNEIEIRFEQKGIAIKKRGFDVVNQDSLSKSRTKLPVLYEVKSCGSKRGKSIAEGFKGFGFTLTDAERKNAKILGAYYKFIFVNVATSRHLVLNLGEFFDKKFSRIYPTWSVFITADLIDRNSLFQRRGRAPDKSTVKR